MADEPSLDPRMLVSRVVVDDQMELEIGRNTVVEMVEKSEKLLVPMARFALSHDRKVGHVDRDLLLFPLRGLTVEAQLSCHNIAMYTLVSVYLSVPYCAQWSGPDLCDSDRPILRWKSLPEFTPHRFLLMGRVPSYHSFSGRPSLSLRAAEKLSGSASEAGARCTALASCT